MKAQLLLMLVLLSASLNLNAEGIVLSKPSQSQNSLKNYQWKKRVLILLTDSAQNTNFVEARIQLLTRKREVQDRDLVTIEETQTQGPWHQRFNSQQAFTVILIGKDGEEKWRTQNPLNLDEVFQIIDSMPMRQSEMKTNR